MSYYIIAIETALFTAVFTFIVSAVFGTER